VRRGRQAAAVATDEGFDLLEAVHGWQTDYAARINAHESMTFGQLNAA
jgi:hypothetical protein